ncbi:MAG: hypothetical protein D8M59_04400 [Planctomycetes bacterium]|nr:hypothetical protein [Planctomycetota bacterium]NOG55749.1 hypothetical protein [Planctomycetota bacterium]
MQRFAIIALVLSAFVFTARPAQAQVLTKSGTCPGIMNFQVTGAAPFSRLAFIHSANTGSWVIPGGIICGTMSTGLAWPVTFGGWVNANGSGSASVNVNVASASCGRFLQVIDTITCTPTNVVVIN